MSVNSLSKGIFWYRKGEILPFLIPCDENGKIIGVPEYPIESKDGKNYNHQKLWARLPRDVTDGVSFDFYPSGTVEISEGRSTVFLHPSLFTSEIELAIVQIFGLVSENKVKIVHFVPDAFLKHMQTNRDLP